MEKPDQFYHGSPDRGLEELTPQRKSFRREGEGRLLFACPDLAGATLFLTRLHDDESKKGYVDGKYYFVVANKEKFLVLDKGGTVYVLPGEDFLFDSNEWSREWACAKPVKPIRTINFNSSLRAMIENGVLVYFTDPETFEGRVKENKIPSLNYFTALGLIEEK
jgi:hypothetical protein